MVAAALLALIVAAGTALAQSQKDKAKARRLFKKASVSYDLGKFDEASELFQEAYEVFPYPNFLFNIGQSYRQKGDCKNAIYFYKRFLSLATNIKASVKADVKSRIAELEETCEATEKIKERPPDTTMPPDNGKEDQPEGDGTEDTTGEEQAPDGDVRDRAPLVRPPLEDPFRLSFTGGPSFLAIGALEISGAQPTVGFGVGYAFQVGPLAMTLGGFATYTPVPWDNGNGETGTSSLASVLANTGIRLPILSKLSVHSELGLGAMVLSGLSDGNVFVPPGTMASGALAMFNLRVSAGAEYEISRSLAIVAEPLVFSFSPAKDGLREDIESFTRFEMMAGLSYRM